VSEKHTTQCPYKTLARRVTLYPFSCQTN
jgi:hypothetical protein